jgi:ESCRT-II complex subunit VPS25
MCTMHAPGFDYSDPDESDQSSQDCPNMLVSLFIQFPEFYQFPPFFTIQPVLATREKQLALWRELILKYYTQHKLKTLVVHDCPLWNNTLIQRKLSDSDVMIVVQDFVQNGHGEWMDATTKTQCRILWRQPEQLATDIYQWAEQKGYLNTVCTLYELHSGEDVNGMSFQGADEELLRRALAILEQQGKCAVFKGETSAEDGIKFF